MELTSWAIFSLLIFLQSLGVKGAGPSLKDPQNGFKYGRLNQNFTMIADVGDNYEKDTCQWFVPNPIQNGASFITLTMGDTTLKNGDGKIRKNSWRYRWIGTNDQRDCGIQIESTVDEDS